MSQSWSKALARFSARVTFLNAAFLLSAAGIAAVGGISHQAAAVEGNGTFVRAINSNPPNIFPYTSNDGETVILYGYLYERLGQRNRDTYAWEPNVASKWETSADGKEFSFTIDPKAKFSNGSKITAEDVKFSFDVIYFDGVQSAAHKPDYEQIKNVEVLAPDKVKFTVKDVFYKNFDSIAELIILPKAHYMELYKKDKTLSKSEVTRNVLGSNAYTIERWDDNQQIVLKRNPNYWNKEKRIAKNTWNQEKVIFKIIPDDAVEIEALKKGDLSFLALGPKQWAKDTTGDEFKTKITKVQANSKQAFSFSYIGWNLKHPILGDKNVRWALSHLVNLSLWSKKFDFDLHEPTVGPFSVKSDEHDKSVLPVPYDPKLASKRLAAAGWTKAGKDGFLVKDGKKLEFTIMYPTQSKATAEPKLTEFKNSAAKVGVSVLLKAVEWTGFLKLMDDRNFDAVTLAWSRDLDPDLKQIWHSASIADKGSNFISYSNPEVDKLIDQQRASLDRSKRIELSQKIEKLIVEDQPYTFLSEAKFKLYAHQNTVTKEKDSFNYEIGFDSWKIAVPLK